MGHGLREFVLPYGAGSVTVRLPGGRVLEPQTRGPAPPPVDVHAEVLRGLDHPMGEVDLAGRLGPSARVCLVSDDYTRPTPSHAILPAVLEFLGAHGVRDDNVVLLCGAGFHREMTEAEREAKFGRATLDRVRYKHHHAERYDTDLVELGTSRAGVPIWVNREAVEADVTIGIGLVEIHPWAGFAGGCKILSPAVAGKVTINATHSLPVTHQADVEMGRTRGNPFWQSCVDAARLAGLDAVINVVLDQQERVVGVFVGEPVAAQAAGIELFNACNELVYARRPELVIISSNPKYQCWGQCAVAAYNGARLVEPGGTVVVLGACPEGLGDSPRETAFCDRSLRPRWQSLDAYWEAMRGPGNEDSRNACAAHRFLYHCQHARILMVTDGIRREVVGPLESLEYVNTVAEALDLAGLCAADGRELAVVPRGGMCLLTVA